MSILIDAQEGVTEQDTKVAGLAHEAGKACIIVVNKWDAIEKDGKTMDKMRQEVMRDLSYMTYAPILFISALTGQRVDRLFDLIVYVNNQASMRITTGMLNSVLGGRHRPGAAPHDKGRRLKIYYMTQVGIKPPHFVCFCNDARLFHFSYQRYLGKPDPRHLRPGGHPGAAHHPAEGRQGGVTDGGYIFNFDGFGNGSVVPGPDYRSDRLFLRLLQRGRLLSPSISCGTMCVTTAAGNAGLTNFYRTFGGPLTFAVNSV